MEHKPIFKQVETIRGVIFLNNFSKLFEILLYNRIYNSLRAQISEYQYGFLNKRLKTINLLIFTQYLSEAFENNDQVDVLYTDFAKAFDRILSLIS